MTRPDPRYVTHAQLCLLLVVVGIVVWFVSGSIHEALYCRPPA